VLYLIGYWTGVLYNLTIDRIPISRLLASDIGKRSGGITAFVVILVVVVCLVINQVRVIRKTGWLPYYAGWYICGGLVLLVLAMLPGLQLRLHHYIIAMANLPGTAFPTKLSAVYQGLLLGMFLNGGAAFGFDSILQTPGDVSDVFFSLCFHETGWSDNMMHLGIVEARCSDGVRTSEVYYEFDELER
jgi:hypothetical protein